MVKTENRIIIIIIIIIIFSLLLRWHYSPVRTIFSLIDFSPSPLFFYLSFHLLILRLLISVSTQSDHLYFGRPLFRLPWELLLNTYFSFTVRELLVVKINFKYTMNKNRKVGFPVTDYEQSCRLKNVRRLIVSEYQSCVWLTL